MVSKNELIKAILDNPALLMLLKAIRDLPEDRWDQAIRTAIEQFQ